MAVDVKDKIKQRLARVVLAVLKTPEVEARLWEIVYRPTLRHRAHDIQSHLYRRAAAEAADYVRQHMPPDGSFETHFDLLRAALAEAKVDGLYLEFGVAGGRSINYIARQIAGKIHGFDSFEGLPEDWIAGTSQGAFDAQGALPEVADNVEIHPGWFDRSLPDFAASNTQPVAFMNIDCDLYSSTKTIFDHLGDRIVPGTVIRFGEYFNYPGWEQHEYKAFQEFVTARGLAYRYIGYSRRNYSVAVVIEGPMEHKDFIPRQASG